MRIEYEGVVEQQPAYQHVGYTAAAMVEVHTGQHQWSAGLGLAVLGLTVLLITFRSSRRLGHSAKLLLGCVGMCAIISGALVVHQSDIDRVRVAPYQLTVNDLAYAADAVDAWKGRSGHLPVVVPDTGPGGAAVSHRDAWGREFEFVLMEDSQRGYTLISAGGDGRFGTPDDLCLDDSQERAADLDEAWRKKYNIPADASL